MNTPGVVDTVARVEELIAQIRAAEQELQALTGGQLDAVVSGSGDAYLLHDAQDRLVRSRDEERALALRQRAILDALSAHIALVDATGVILAVNAAWEAFGLANGATDSQYGVGSSYLEVSRAAAAAGLSGAVGTEFAADVAQGLADVLEGRREDFALEYPCHAPSQQRWYRVMITPVRDERIRGAVVMHLDVTERRTTEAALRQSRTLQVLAERMGRIGGWRIELPERTLVWSDQVCAIHGLPSGSRPTPDEALAMYPGEHREAVRAAMAACATAGTSFDIELPLIAGKERKWVRAIGQAQRDSTGTIVALEGALQDITEQKKLEQQFLRAQRMESVGTLAGGIAHDLNNVLTPILMSLELLRMAESDAERLDLIAGIEQAATRGADMVRQVLTFARGAEGQRAQVQLRHLVGEIERFARETFPRSITVRAQIAPGVRPVLGDATQLHQVLVNLCVNARDAMPSGGTLSLNVAEQVLDVQYAGMTSEVRPGRYVVVTVEDTGTGMSPEVIERIFEPFFTTKDIGKGTGLGLSTSAAIAKSHGGFIRVYSELGVGSRFRVYLPSIEEAAVAAAATATAEVPRGNGELVLVVDDEAAVRHITQQTLEAFGYRVLCAGDGAAGIAAFASQRDQVKLVLTDMMMPVMDGAALIEVLLRMDPSMRIIASSGLPTHQQALRTPMPRVRDFLLKPYSAETLLSTVRRALDA